MTIESKFNHEVARREFEKEVSPLWISYEIQRGINNEKLLNAKKEDLEICLAFSSSTSSTSSTSLPCRASVKQELISNLFWLAEQGNSSQLTKLLVLMETEGISLSAKVKKTLTKKLEMVSFSKVEQIAKEKEGVKPQTHEGNAKSKEKWSRSGKEARRLCNK